MGLSLQFLGTPSYHVLSLILASTAALQSLIAIWAATSSRHWFWRALAAWAAVVALVPIRAYQPAVIFSLSSLLIVALIGLRKLRRDSHRPPTASSEPPAPRLRFGLRDIFLLMVIVGLWLAGLQHIVVKAERIDWPHSLLTAAAIAVVATVSWVTAQSSRRAFWGALLLVSVAMFAVLIPLRGQGYDYYEFWMVLNVIYYPDYRAADFLRISQTLGLLAILVIAASAVAGSIGSSLFFHGTTALRRGTLVFVLLLFAAPLAFIYWQMLQLAPLPPRFSEAENHFDRLLAIAERMEMLALANPTAAVQEERDALIAESIILLQAANYVPHETRFDTVRQVWTDNWEIGKTLRNLTRAIDGQSAAAIAGGELDRACELAEANARLGVMLQRGSHIAEYLVGVAVTSLSAQRVIGVRRELSPENSRKLIAAWERVLAERESLRVVLDRDHAVSERIYGWGARLTHVVEALGIRSDSYYFLRAGLRQETLIRLLQTDLAIRLYQQDHGALPINLDQLVPQYLAELPPDPFSTSNLPLCYRIDGDDFALYSVGNDGVDNGGQLTNERNYYMHNGSGHHGYGYDYDLDTHTRP
jgi:hypothetical protein